MTLPRRDYAELRRVADDLLALPSILTAPALARRDAPAFLVAWGWYMRVNRTARAVLSLIEDDFGEEGAPLVRSMIEHVIALRRLADAPDETLASLRRHRLERTRKLRDAATEAEWPIPADLFGALLADEAPATSEDHLLAFAHACRHYGEKHLYVAWLAESSSSHPTFVSAQAYVDGDGLDDLALHDTPQREDRDLSAQVPLLLLLASGHLNTLLPGQSWQSALDGLAARYAAAVSPSPNAPTQ